jgi:hypothetical protein
MKKILIFWRQSKIPKRIDEGEMPADAIQSIGFSKNLFYPRDPRYYQVTTIMSMNLSNKMSNYLQFLVEQILFRVSHWGIQIYPVYSGEIQSLGLGMSVEFLIRMEKNQNGGKRRISLHQTISFNAIGFFNDSNKLQYRKSYFEKFENIWTHGDYAELTENNGLIIHGRSDATLNSGGVRIGTAEIYRQVEKIPEILESVAISETGNQDTLITLFVVLKEGQTLTNELKEKIKQHLK